MPLSLDAFRVTRAWASGQSWQDLVATAEMAEGDVFRLMRRTLDAEIPTWATKSYCMLDHVRVFLKHDCSFAVPIFLVQPFWLVKMWFEDV